MPKSDNKYTAKDIKVLEGLEPVRKRPGMYIGSTDKRGLHELVKEIIDNSVDEAIAGYAKHIYIHIHQDGKITISDDGRGIPTDMHTSGVSALEVTMTKLHAGGKFEETAYQASGGLHGVGSSAVNALSQWLRVEVRRDGAIYAQEYKRGKPLFKVKKLTPAEVKTSLSAQLTPHLTKGTTTQFDPDPQIFKETTNFSFKTIADRVRERAYLIASLHFHLFDERDGTEKNFYFEGGIKSLVDHLNSNKKSLHETIALSSSTEIDGMPIGVEVALQYNDSFTENIQSFANVINTYDGGTHITGFRSALNRTLKDYAKKNGIIKTDKDNFTSDDLKEGLTAVVFVKMSANDIQFESQTKAKLNNSEAQSAVYQIVKEGLDTQLEENPGLARTILGKVLLAAKARMAARAAKDAVIRKGALEGGALPGKLADCQEKDASKSEIFIVEGDSAGGTAKQGRDRRFQAIFPLKGKMLNTERARLDKIIDTEEIKNLIIALGAGIGETFDPSKLRYHRIILMNDADVDGEHITTLGLTFFFRHLRSIIDEGYLYIAMPPLFKVQYKSEIHYAFTDTEKDELVNSYKAKADPSKISIQRYKGLGEMNTQQLWETTMDPTTRILKRVTVDDAQLADQTFTTLMGDEVPPRRKFIQTHAKMATLDI